MAINFTNSPSNGDTQAINGRTYTYNSAKNKWDTTATEVTGPTAAVYATVNDLPGSATTGDQAFVSGTNRLYIWNGSGWYNIALVNNTPTWTNQPNSSYALAIDGTATTITIVAADPEGLPITYSIASDTSGDIATVTQGTGQQSNTWTITPSTSNADAGTFSLTFRASDGVNVATAVSEFTLEFIVQNSNYTTSLITTNGSTGQNTTFTDSSSNSHTVTANGNVNQSSFSPYRSGGYSLFCNGSGGDYIKTDTSADFAFGSNDFTVECWYYPVSKAQNYPRILHFGEYWSNNRAWGLLDRHNTSNTKFTVQSFALGTILESTTTVSNNQWYHLAVVRNGSTITLYVNGAAEDTYNISTNNYPAGFSTSYLSLLNVSDGSNLNEAQANGYLRDVRVVQGTAVYTSAFTPTTESLTAVSNTKFLLGSIPYIFDSSTSAHTFTQTTGGDYSTKPFGPYDYQEYAVGDHGGSAYFDGTGDYLSISGNNIMNFGSSDWTVEGWVYLEAMPTSDNWPSAWSSHAMLCAVGTPSLGDGFNCIIGQTQIFVQSNDTKYGSATHDMSVNRWHHLAYVRSGNTIYFYVDGVQKGTTAFSGSVGTGSTTYIGTETAQGAYLNGNITDLRVVKGTAVYTEEFTPPTEPFTSDSNTSLLLGMQDAKILDKSQSVKTITLSGGTVGSTSQTKYLSSSINFDGVDDEITIPQVSIAASEDFTIECWHYLTSRVDSFPALFGNYNSFGTGALGLFVGHNNSTTTQYQVAVSGTFPFINAGTINYNQWVHVALVRSGSTITLYIDGTSVGSGTSSVALNGVGNDFFIGRIGDSASGHIEGYMSDFRITKGLARYTANFTPPTEALKG